MPAGSIIGFVSDRQTFRVTIRGRFHHLTARASAYLFAERAEHDIFVSAYTSEGSLTYDDRIDFFSLRYECRAADAEAAASQCLDEAERFLDTMGFGHRDLRVNVVDLSAMWDDAARHAASG